MLIVCENWASVSIGVRILRNGVSRLVDLIHWKGHLGLSWLSGLGWLSWLLWLLILRCHLSLDSLWWEGGFLLQLFLELLRILDLHLPLRDEQLENSQKDGEDLLKCQLVIVVEVNIGNGFSHLLFGNFWLHIERVDQVCQKYHYLVQIPESSPVGVLLVEDLHGDESQKSLILNQIVDVDSLPLFFFLFILISDDLQKLLDEGLHFFKANPFISIFVDKDEGLSDLADGWVLLLELD